MKKPDEKIYHVRQEEAKQTLAALLRRWLPGQSWKQVERLVHSRHVQINGNLCLDAGRRLKTTEVVKVLPHSAAPLPDAEAVKIRHLDQHLVVVEKPSGMTSLRHYEERDWPARRKQLQPTLHELLPKVIARKSGAASQREPRERTGSHLPVRAVHRLDRETSGLMVFARTIKAERGLGEQFRVHSIHRKYRAIVVGELTSARTITTYLVRDRGDGRRGSAAKPDTTEGKRGAGKGDAKKAVTHVTPIEHLNGFTLVECRLETGRTHQIRIHLAELGHPVCGEKVYGQPLRGTQIADRSGAPRIALHAFELGFMHPVTAEPLQFHMPLPPDLQEFLRRLRGEAKSDAPSKVANCEPRSAKSERPRRKRPRKPRPGR